MNAAAELGPRAYRTWKRHIANRSLVDATKAGDHTRIAAARGVLADLARADLAEVSLETMVEFVNRAGCR